MKKLLLILIVSLAGLSCTKEKEETIVSTDDIQVMVYATHANDTAIVAATRIVHMKIK